MIEISAAGFRFVARFEEEGAPATVAAFLGILPFEDRIIHCRWSGESNWIPWGDRELGIGPENATSYPAPGQLLLYPGGISHSPDEDSSPEDIALAIDVLEGALRALGN